MSGVEIAGLVLGCIPLLIAALEHHEDIIGPTVSALKYRGELARATRELRDQRSLFQQSLMVLLKPMTRPQQLAEMMDNSGSVLWKEQSIDAALRGHLGIAYVTYMDTVQDVERVIVRIASKIQNLKGTDSLKRYGLVAIIKQHPPARTSGRSGRFEFSSALKFTMSRQKIRASLEELVRLVERLDQIQAKADKLQESEDIMDSRSHSKFAIPLHIIRRNATKLYHVLFNSWCSGHNSHLAGLLLEPRLVRKTRRGTSARKKTEHVSAKLLPDAHRFGVSLHRSCLSTRWLDVEIKPIEADANQSQNAKAVKVKIVAPQPAASSASEDAELPYGDPASLQLVTDICAAIQRSSTNRMGLYLDSQGRLRGIFDTACKVAYANNYMTLKELILQGPGQLSLQDRYSLSITLVSSLLQLTQTPWMQNSQLQTDIVFLRASSRPGSSTGVDVGHPYLTRTQQLSSTTTPSGIHETDSSKLLHLAVMLLEIYYCRPIEDLQSSSALAIPLPKTDLSSFQAVRDCLAMKKNSGEITHAFLTAISYCHQCFADGSATLANDELSQAVIEKVLLPLEEEMHMIMFGPSMG